MRLLLLLRLLLVTASGGEGVLFEEGTGTFLDRRGGRVTFVKGATVALQQRILFIHTFSAIKLNVDMFDLIAI